MPRKNLTASELPARAPMTTWLLAVIPLLFVIACLGPGKKDRTCVATLTSQGKTFTGEAETEADARRFACNGYCRDADPEYEARYNIWLDSPRGKKAGRPSKEKAIFEDRELLDYVTITCANRCLQEVTAGKHNVDVTCK